MEVFDKENGCWVSKQDVGTTGYTEKEKSQASDSFKRACFNWGIGRELYTAPFIWIPCKDAEIGQKDGKYYCRDRFSVSSIGYNGDREINLLTIINDTRNGKLVYTFRSGSGQAGRMNVEKPDKNQESVVNSSQVRNFEAELRRTGVGLDAVKDRYGIGTPQEMSKEIYDKVMRALAKTKSAGNVA